MAQTADIVICGAGITGIAAAHSLSEAGIHNILLLDERPPLSLTSDKSTECYRNWWPDPVLHTLIDRSIDLMDELADRSGNVFHMNRRGYLYITADEGKVAGLEAASHRISKLGAGPLRIHASDDFAYQPARPDGFHDSPAGANLLLGSELIRKHFPYLTEGAVAALHARRAGWLSAQQLGMYLLETGRNRGVRFESAQVTGVDVANGRVRGVRLSSGQRVDSPIFINAAGPYLKTVGRYLGVELPVHSEIHLKAVIKDSLQVVGREAPLLVWLDPQSLPWTEDERSALTEDNATSWMTEFLPSGAHTRPEGAGADILMLWEYRTKVIDPIDPLPIDDQYPELALRGLAAMLPRMKEYFPRMPRPQVDGGYYTKTRENRPLVGRMGVEGAYVLGAVSGYGIMAACGVAELLTSHVTSKPLPAYADDLLPSRYDNPEYLKSLETLDENGQL